MAWFKVDDGLHSSRKILKINKRARFAAIGLWTIAGSWSADQLTDGHIPDYMIAEFGAPPSAPESLVFAELWDRTHDGYTFRNWSEYQPSKQDVDAERAASRERMRDLRAKRKQLKPLEQADPGEVFERTGPNGSESVRNPDPTRPDPTLIEEACASSATRKKPAVRLPASWGPNEAHTQYAKAEGIALDFQAERFRTHAEANDRRIANWDAAFRNWLLKAERTKAKPAASSPWSKEFHR